MEDREIRVAIADDHDIIRQGLKRIISLEDDLKLVGEAENGEKILKLIQPLKPDVLVLDINMPILNGMETLKIAKEEFPAIKIILLTVENSRETIQEAISTGADGYILKESAGTEIVEAIRMVNNGEKYIDKALVSTLFSYIKNKERTEASRLDVLTKREVEILLRISKGLSNKEIGEELFISEKSVKNYATGIFRKLNVNDRVQATIAAIQCSVENYYGSKFGSGQ